MSAYIIREFTKARLSQVRAQWKSVAGEDEFELELGGFFDWCEDHISPCDGDSQAWELYAEKTDSCDAIVELVDSRKGELTKMLKLFVTPEMWDVEAHRSRIVSLYVDCFTQVIAKGILQGTKNVKLYGRNDLMFSILRSLHAAWPAEETRTQAEVNGRWLTITIG